MSIDRVSGEPISNMAHNHRYGDVFVRGDLVYAIEDQPRVMYVYRNHNNSLIKLHSLRYPCKCLKAPDHSIVVTNEHVIQCCALYELISILDHSGKLLQTIDIDDTFEDRPFLCQVDVEGNFLISDRETNRLLIAHADQPGSQWDVVDLADWPGSGGCRGAIWFRQKLFVVSGHRLMTYTPEH